MADNPNIVQQVPLDRVTQALYAKIHTAMEPVRRELAESQTATSRWVSVFAEFRDSLPELNLPAYHEMRSALGALSDLFARAVGAPLAAQTCLLAFQVIEHDLPRVAAIAAKLNEEDAPKFFSAMAKDRPGMTLAYFETPEVQPRTRIKKADFDHAISTILKKRFDDLEHLVRQDTVNWLRSQGVPGDTFEIVDGEGPRFVFRREGSVWKVILNGCPEFHIPNSLGARYLDWLLHNANDVIGALDLEQAVTPEKATVRGKEAFDDGTDKEMVRQYLRNIERLRAEVEDARADNDTAEADRIEGEIDVIEKELKKRGRYKDSGEKARNNVRKAIDAVKRALARGDKHQKAFLSHIEDMVKTGYKCQYVQPQGKIWQ